ncbi:hypothetical protein P170DRAFT_423840 [Aspergillus steynii IBT 23096]|uniref:Uncharacterized protein n=1 Tax=Aspergillus steynii IBT 23096 TaxID=1392250 RepID=A0A2I2GJL8_9EURO|nr:uncharacterized protein P170DRAFT_423840 [Aspergillus steynii IBT 23096]PLB53064.1 hypothetical protein P170DRAFT_423840 [Aspergillus steynii IBT 23096]
MWEVPTEYILDGRRLKLGSGKAARAAQRVTNDLEDWSPGANAPDFDRFVWVEGEKVGHLTPFTITKPTKSQDLNKIDWARRVTAPMPLRVINKLMRQGILDPDGPLSPVLPKFKERMVWVGLEYFRSRPQGIELRDLTDDALRFFALVLSYAKASGSCSGRSPKFSTSIMPRTDFATMFRLANLDNILRDKSFYEIVKIASCYEIDKTGHIKRVISIDPRYSNGTLEEPLPNNKLDTAQFVIGEAKINVRDWLEGIQHGTDILSEFDADHGDTQIGALGMRTERVFGRQELAPIFVFRNLGSSKKEAFARDVQEAEECVIRLHMGS